MPLRQPTNESLTGVIAALDERVRELTARDKNLLAEQIKLEGADVRPASSNVAQFPPCIDAAAMLERGELVESEHSDRLTEIVRERAAIAAAITLAGQRAFRQRVANEAELAGDIHDAWAANIKNTAQIVRRLRDLADERVRLRAEYGARVGLPFNAACGLAADRVVGQFTHADAAQAFLEAAQAANLS
ncbi:MAG TPA: hypothetical protein VNU97_15285 [Rhizomicrobium sp.]|jgi:hypothetical protein|nr:hypothetical protein [Rhizomicrobium sp.]